MEKLTFTDLKTSNRKFKVIEDIIISILLSVSFVSCLNDLFELKFTIKEAFSGNITGGFIATWNYIADAVGKSDYIILKQFSGASESNGLFITLFLCICILAGYFIVKDRKTWMLLIYIVPVVFVNFATELEVGEINCVFISLSVLLAIIHMISNYQGFIYNVILIMIIGIVIYASFQFLNLDNMARKPEFIKNINEKTTQLVSDLYYGRNPLGNGDMWERERHTSDQIALKVTMDKPQSLYLRGFVGDIYAGNTWKALDDSIYYSARKQMNWFKADKFNPEGQIGQTDSFTNNDSEKSEISIKVENADKRYGYIPYEIQNFTRETGSEVRGGNFIKAVGIKPLKEYSYNVSNSVTQRWTEAVAKLFTDTSENQQLTQYFIDESYYNQYVYENYTYVSEQDKKILQTEFGPEPDLEKNHVAYKTAINNIKDYFNKNIIYTEKILETPIEGRTALEDFFSIKKGYDVQYATAATLMFRYYGIPARYVEGFLITPENVSNVEPGKEISVSDDNAHAWVEIYIDGAGFVPIEVCPDDKVKMEQADLSIGLSNSILENEFITNDKGITEDRSSSNGGARKTHPDWKWLIVLILPLMLIFILIIYLIYSLIKRLITIAKQKKLFTKGEPKLAVSYIYQYMGEKKYPLSDMVKTLGNRAAYSRQIITEEERQLMLKELGNAKKHGKIKKNNKKK